MLVEKVPDVANLALGALSFGQFVSGQPFSRGVALVGCVIWLGFTAVALLIARDDDR